MYTNRMSVYLFTFHAYRSWNADNPRGYVRRGQGMFSPDVTQAHRYDQHAKQPPMLFEETHQRVMLWIVSDACQRRGWRLHQIACESTHIHVLVSWKNFLHWEQVSSKLKNLMSRELGRRLSLPGRRWFSTKGSRKRVRDRRHFEYLMQRYLPGHHGLVWREGDPLPQLPSATAGGFETPFCS